MKVTTLYWRGWRARNGRERRNCLETKVRRGGLERRLEMFAFLVWVDVKRAKFLGVESGVTGGTGKGTFRSGSGRRRRGYLLLTKRYLVNFCCSMFAGLHSSQCRPPSTHLSTSLNIHSNAKVTAIERSGEVSVHDREQGTISHSGARWALSGYSSHKKGAGRPAVARGTCLARSGSAQILRR